MEQPSLTIRDGGPSSVGGSTDPDSIPCGTPATIDGEEYYEVLFHRYQWEEALNQAKKDLRPEEQAEIERFKTPDHLMVDLKERLEQRPSDEAFRRVVFSVHPYLNVVRDLSSLFLFYMRPYAIETALIWGLVHITISGVGRWRDVQSRLSAVQSRVNTSLETFQHVKDGLGNPKLVRSALLEVHVAMIHLWLGATKTLRVLGHGRPAGAPLKPVTFKETLKAPLDVLQVLDGNLDKALGQIELAVSKITQLAQIDTSIARRRAADENMAGQLSFTIDFKNLTYYSPLPKAQHFVGRDVALQMINDHLTGTSDAMDLGMRTVVLHGLGGMGKTSLAYQYAARCKESGSFAAVFHLDSEADLNIEASFDKIARSLEITGTNSQETVIKVHHVLNKMSNAGRRWLLIADNLANSELLLKYLPDCTCFLLITTRYHNISRRGLGHIKKIEVGPLDVPEAASLFFRLSDAYSHSQRTRPDRDEESRQTEALLRHFGGHPLAIELLTAHMNIMSYDASTMREKLKSHMKQIRSNEEGGSLNQHNLVSLFEVQFKAIRGSPAAIILGAMTMFYPTNIPEQAFDFEENRHLWLRRGIQDAEVLTEGLGELIRSNLVTPTGNGRFFSIHRIVQDAYQHTTHGLNDKLQEPFDLACSLVLQLYPKIPGSTSHSGKWDFCHKILPHATAILDAFIRSQKVERLAHKPSADFLDTLQHTTYFLFEIGDLDQCMMYLDDTTQYLPQGPQDQFKRAKFYNTSGTVYKERNHLKLSRTNFERMRDLLRVCLHPDDPYWQHCHNNLAGLLYAEGHNEEAVEYFKLAIDNCKKNGAFAESLARYKMGIGRARYSQGNLEEAAKLFTEADDLLKSKSARPSPLIQSLYALTLSRSNLQVTSPMYRVQADILYSLLHDYGNLAKAQKDYERAKTMYEQALELGKTCAESHPLMAAVHCKLGIVEAELENQESSRDHFGKGLAIAKFRNIGGEVARITYHRFKVLRKAEPQTEEVATEAAKLEAEAISLKHSVSKEQGQDQVPEDTDEGYDSLVGGYFR